MAKARPLDPNTLQWLRSNHETQTFTTMAQHVGCCVDTLKRVLVREGLRSFEGAKYQVSRDFQEKMWDRPCLTCKKPEQRPKNWFFCRACRREMGYEDY